MPIFDYVCPECEKVKRDKLVSSASENVFCECSWLMQRLPAAPNAHFVGSGFHATDYGTGNSPKGAETPRKAPVGKVPVSQERA
jgi:predicted nucleic acid-binding Zn ribbon protein